MKRRGFTLIELLVVVAIIALLIAILLPSLGKARELSNRSTCAANVRGIIQSMHVYGSDNSDVYPCVRPPTAANAFTNTGAGTATNVDQAYTQLYGGGLLAGNVMANLWILCIKGDVTPKQFICKSDPVSPTQASLTTAAGQYNLNFNLNGQNNITDFSYSYSFAYPWVGGTGNPSVGGWWKSPSDASVVIAGDMSPKSGQNSTPNSSTVTKNANSNNHQREGQVVGFSDVHSEFYRTHLVGQGNDNIWTSSGTANGGLQGGQPAQPTSVPGFFGGPAGAWDTVLVPIADVSTGNRG